LAYEINWMSGYQGRIIHERIHGDVTIEDLHDLPGAADRLMDTDAARKPVHLLIDTLGVKSFPKSLSTIRNAVPGGRHPNLGWTLMVSSSVLVGTMTRIIAQIMQLEFRTFPSMEAALAFLYERDMTLTENPAKNEAR